MKNKVFITGAGVVSAIGVGKEANWNSLSANQSGIGEVRYLNTVHHEFPVGEVKMSNEEMKHQLGINAETIISRAALLGILAVKEAVKEAQVEEQQLALISGTTVGGMDLTEEMYPDALTADIINQHDCGGTTNAIADYFGCFDFTSTSSTACSSALNAIIFGARMIQSGMRDIVVVGGTESLTRFHLNGFKSLMILDEENCRPFDAGRRGLNLGEGAGYLVLESEKSLQRRGVKAIARLEGMGNACDAFHQTASSANGEGAYLAMCQALTEAQLEAKDIQYVNAHGTGTPNNDASESAALRRVFGNDMPLISSTKGLTGHTTSASGSIETVFSVMALRHQMVPANYGWHQCDEDCISPQSVPSRAELYHVVCNSFGFGGNDSSIIIGVDGK